jgi:hypothetical protein
MEIENLIIGDGVLLDSCDGQCLIEMKPDNEARHLQKLCISMQSSGFVRHDGPHGDVEGWVLVRADGAYCVQIRGGQHRAAVASALGFVSIPVRISHAAIKYEMADYWPQVRAGRMSKSGAQSVFDRVLEGKAYARFTFAPTVDSSSCRTRKSTT